MSQIKQSNVEVNLMLYYVESGQLVAFVWIKRNLSEINFYFQSKEKNIYSRNGRDIELKDNACRMAQCYDDQVAA